MQQAQYIGPVMVNGQMMNLWGMSDFKSFVSDVSNAVNDVAQVGADLIDTTRDAANTFSPILNQLNPELHDKVMGHLNTGLDMASTGLDVTNQVNGQVNAYLPQLPFNQQQQLQQLLSWNDFTNGVRYLKDQVTEHGSTAIDAAQNGLDALGNICPSCHSKINGDVLSGHLDTASDALDRLANIRFQQQQQQLQQLGFGFDINAFGHKVTLGDRSVGWTGPHGSANVNWLI